MCPMYPCASRTYQGHGDLIICELNSTEGKEVLTTMTLITATVCSGFGFGFKVGLIHPPADDPEEEPEYNNFLPHDSYILR